jgi:FAD/FMN-containing dehydrogenase
MRIDRRELIKRLTLGMGTSLLATRGAYGRSQGAERRLPDWTKLQAAVRGQLVSRGSTAYETTRQSMVWNAVKSARFPDAIVRVQSHTEVMEAVRFAREHDLKVGIRGGGHNWHNPALRQGGLLLDLSGLTESTVDAARRQATVQPGVIGAGFMAELAPRGFAFPIGHCPSVPMSGFLLNGGSGWNYRAWGPACANVHAFDIVNARGESIHATKDQNTDLFWAARGAGPGFFGVVTRFHLNLFALPPVMMRSSLRYPVEDMDRVAAWMSRLVPFDDPVELSCQFTGGGVRINAVAFADTIGDARKALAPLEAEPTGLVAAGRNLYQEASVDQVFGAKDTKLVPGPRYEGDSGWSNASPAELLAAVRERLSMAPAGAVVQLVFFHGQPRPGLPDMACSMFGSTYVHAHTLSNDASQDAASHTWLQGVIASLEPLKIGHYVGEADLGFAPDRAQRCFSTAAWSRLTSLKRRYDPNDVFFTYLR